MHPFISPKNAEPPETAYRERLKSAQARSQALSRRADTVGILRFVVFIMAALTAGVALEGRGPRGLLFATSAAALLGYIGLVLYHGDLLARRERARLLAACNRAGLRRLDGSWMNTTRRGIVPQNPPPYAEDLDLHGAGSLTALINTTQTRYGFAALWRSLSHAAAPTTAEAVLTRQAAVREFTPLLDFRQALEVAGRAMHGPYLDDDDQKRARPSARKHSLADVQSSEPDPEPLLRWAESPPSLSNLPLLPALRFLPLLTIPLLLVLLSVSQTPPRPLGWLAIGLVVAQGLVMLYSAPRVSQLLGRVSSSEAALSAYGEMLSILIEAPFSTPENQALTQRLQGENGVTPEQALKALRGTYSMLELRSNFLFWFPLNLFLLWDLFFALKLERWQAQHGQRLRGWMEALGEAEARACLAHLGHDNPEWAWPEFHSGGLSASALAHPLLPASRRIGNDVFLPGPGHAMLVTGSNMSGKSTLLRSIGLLQVLAQAGAPVCAKRAQLPILTLRTVVRVDDSLARGLSHFYAELQRLKDVVDTTSAIMQSQAPLLYLLDEILHGTNTRERELGARLTIRTLCQRGAIGVVTTHDLSLSTLEDETAGAVQNFHFTEIVENGSMRFDYKLRPGPARSSNALRLMRACGIDLDWTLLPSPDESCADASSDSLSKK